MGSSQIQGPLWGHRPHDWAELQEKMHLPLYEHAFERLGVGAGTRLLDAGCGSGLALELAVARGATVSGIDAAEALLAVARSRVPGAELRAGDLEQLPWSDETFDAVTGFNAFQYTADPQAALREARRVCRPGGRVVIAVWSPPEKTQASALLAALKPLMPPAPPNVPGPFALSDETALRGLAERAGLQPVEIHDVPSPFVYPDLETSVRAISSSGPAARAKAHAGDEAVERAHREALEKFRRPDGSVSVGNSFRYLIARAG